MNSRPGNPTKIVIRSSTLLFCGVVLIQLFVAQIDAQRSTSRWQTLNGDAPLVIARGGFSGLFPDSSLAAYQFAMQASVADVILWCDVQLTKDEVGICFPDLNLANASNIQDVYSTHRKSYLVNGVTTQGWFPIDFSLTELQNVSLIRGILSRSEKFDENGFAISTIQDVNTQLLPKGFWLNVPHDAFYEQQNYSMSSFLLSAARTVSIDFISSPEVGFFRKIAGRYGRNGPSFVFQFLRKEDFEPTTNRTYGSILNNLTFVKTFASGILVPKSYILQLDDKHYLLPPTSLVQDAHKAGLKLYASGFANDVDIAYNYSWDPVSEYLSFVDNFCPKVSDFGLAKLCEKKESILSMLDTRGTIGYIAPEMISRVYGNVSHKSDVYSYGMLVLEIIGARNKEKANQASPSNTSSMYFPEWVYRDLESGKSGRHIEDGINNVEDELAKKMTLVGLWCIQPSPVDRPAMNKVVEMMEGSLEALEVPPRPVLQQIPRSNFQESSTLSEEVSVYTEG